MQWTYANSVESIELSGNYDNAVVISISKERQSD